MFMCLCVYLLAAYVCVQVKWPILMWGFKSAGGAEDRRKHRSRWMDGRIRGGRGTWVGSEVEGGQVEFERVCV